MVVFVKRMEKDQPNKCTQPVLQRHLELGHENKIELKKKARENLKRIHVSSS